MVFRLPSHLETFVPPPTDQRPLTTPWRGSLIVAGMRRSDMSSSQAIRVTAVETDGENRVQHWPAHFNFEITHGRTSLRNLQAWVKQYTPPLCTFMPDNHRDPNLNTVNLTNFRSLSRILFEEKTVAIASWGSDVFPGAGIIVYPAQNSSAMLVGVLFFFTSFPEFITGISSPSVTLSPVAVHQQHQHQHQHQHQQHQQRAQYQHMPIASSSYSSPPRQHAHSSSPNRSDPNSPVEQPISAHGRESHYRFIMPRGTMPFPPQGQAPSANPPGWPGVKDEDNVDYTTYSPNHPQPPFP